MAQIPRPADTLIICESTWGIVDVEGDNLFDACPIIFAHQAGKVASFVFYDGHAKTKKWLSTLFPLNQNNWELNPNPDPNNHKLNGVVGCQAIVPPGPDAPLFQKPD